MKKTILIIVCLFSSFGLTAQQPVIKPSLQVENQLAKNIGFKKISPAKDITTHGAINETLKQLISRQTVFKLNTTQLSQLSGNENLELELPLDDGTPVNILLVPVDIFTGDFSIVTQDGPLTNLKRGKHYRGIVKGDANSIAAFSFFDDEMAGLFSTRSAGNYVVGKLNSTAATAYDKGTHIIYNDKNLDLLPPFNCGTSSKESIPYSPAQLTLSKTEVTTNFCVRLYYETEFDMFQRLGTAQGVANYVSYLHNQVSTLFANDGIRVALSQVFIWTINDPFETIIPTNIGQRLDQFGAYRTNFNGDVAQLLTFTPIGGGLAKYANLDGFCQQQQPAVSVVGLSGGPEYINVPVYSTNVNFSTHEFGHLMGSRHTHDCVWTVNGVSNRPIDGCGPIYGPAYLGYNPEGQRCFTIGPLPPAQGGTIMSYCHLTLDRILPLDSVVGINFANGFGPLPRAVMQNNINNGGACLGANCTDGNPCPAPGFISLSGLTYNTAVLNWGSTAGAISYTFQYKKTSVINWSTPVNTTLLSATLTLLSDSTQYEFRIRANCASGSGNYTTTYFPTPGIPCNPPGELIVLNNTALTATFNWAPVANVTGYDVEIAINNPPTAVTWNRIGTNILATTITATGLLPLTNYLWRVRSVCSPGSSSNFSIGTGFITPGCGKPAGLTCINSTTNSLAVGWNAITDATGYMVQYRRVSTFTWLSLNTSTTDATITGLSASTPYEWRVRASCPYGTSEYSDVMQCSTLPASATCAVPAGLYCGTSTSASVTLNWAQVPGAVNYSIAYKPLFAPGTAWVAGPTVTSTFATVSGLISNTIYDIGVQANCSGSSSGYRSIACTTLAPGPTCNAPSGLLASDVGGSYSYVNWNTAAGAQSYRVEYKKKSDPLWIPVANAHANTIYLFTGLTPSTIYQWRLRSNCVSTTSDYSVIAEFRTGISDDLRVTTGMSAKKMADEISFSPNPANQTINVRIDNHRQKMNIELFDIYGKLVLKQAAFQVSTTLDISRLTSGVYLLKITGNSGNVISSRKFVKQ